METIKRWYVIIAVVAFTFCFPVMGRTPAGWALAAVSWIVAHAPHVNH
jgi:hypothetical protein